MAVDLAANTLRFHNRCLTGWHEARAERMAESNSAEDSPA
jgi:hypothetical protein